MTPALEGAFRKGSLAYQAGLSLDACPYRDKRAPSGKLTWSRAFRTAWADGWRAAEKEKLAAGRVACHP